jgi:hypothetical protein
MPEQRALMLGSAAGLVQHDRDMDYLIKPFQCVSALLADARSGNGVALPWPQRKLSASWPRNDGESQTIWTGQDKGLRGLFPPFSPQA